MSQKVMVIQNSSEKIIEETLKKMVAEGHTLLQVTPLSKTSFLVISNLPMVEVPVGE